MELLLFKTQFIIIIMGIKLKERKALEELLSSPPYCVTVSSVIAARLFD